MRKVCQFGRTLRQVVLLFWCWSVPYEPRDKSFASFCPSTVFAFGVVRARQPAEEEEEEKIVVVGSIRAVLGVWRNAQSRSGRKNKGKSFSPSPHPFFFVLVRWNSLSLQLRNYRTRLQVVVLFLLNLISFILLYLILVLPFWMVPASNWYFFDCWVFYCTVVLAGWGELSRRLSAARVPWVVGCRGRRTPAAAHGGGRGASATWSCSSRGSGCRGAWTSPRRSPVASTRPRRGCRRCGRGSSTWQCKNRRRRWSRSGGRRRGTVSEGGGGSASELLAGFACKIWIGSHFFGYFFYRFEHC